MFRIVVLPKVSLIVPSVAGYRPPVPPFPKYHSARLPAGTSAAAFNTTARVLTIRSFLSTNAIRATNSQDGIDYCSSNNSVPCAVKSITVPVLFAAMGAYSFIRDNEIHYELAVSKDKDYIVVEGATHGATPCRECEDTPGQYANSVANFFDYVAQWINSRFSRT